MAPPGPPPSEDSILSGILDDPPAAPMTNGLTPSATSDGAERIWDRPWTLDEIRKGSSNWSLAGDAGLLNYLQQFSQNIISRTHDMGKQVDGLVRETKMSGVRVTNVFNDFIMLANTQFVENRVYDEDVSHDPTADEPKKPENEEKTREQREAELIPKITEALKFGVDVVEHAFERLDSNVANSDSEDEETGYKVEPILEAKDPYITRPLPYLIGTPQFVQDDNVGLVDIPSDEELEDDVGSISASESDSEKADISESESDSEYSDSDEDSEMESRPRKKSVGSSSEESEDDEDGDLFGTTKKDRDEESSEEYSEEEAEEAPAPKKGLDFTSELASKLGIAAAPPPARDEDEDDWEEESGHEAAKPDHKKSKSEKKHKKKPKSGGAPEKAARGAPEKAARGAPEKAARGAPEKSAQDDDLFTAQAEDDDNGMFSSSAGLFSSGKGLFDDDQTEGGGLFDDEVDTKPASKKKVAADKRVEPEHQSKKEKKSKRKSKTSESKSTASGGLFDDKDDGDLFDSVEKPKPTKEKRSSSKTTSKTTSKAAESKPVEADGLFGESEDEGLFDSAVRSDRQKAKSQQKASVDLFADAEENDDGDLFGNAPQEPVAPPQEKAKKQPLKKKLPPGAVSMFGNAPNPLSEALRKKQHPSEDEDEASDFSDEEKPRASSIKSSSGSVSSITKSVDRLKKTERSASGSSNSLFADEPEDDLFTTKAKPSSKSKTAASPSSLFDDDGDLFGDGKKLEAASKPAQPKVSSKPRSGSGASTTKPRSGSLFDEDKEDDIFAAKPKEAPAKKKPIGGVALFGGADLFGKKAAKTEKVTTPEEKVRAVPQTAPATPQTAPATLSLFDNQEEDNVFGISSTDEPEPTKKSESKPAPKTKPRTKSKSLFADEDVLFGGAEEDPDVDLFGSQSPLTPTKPESKPFPQKAKVPVDGATVTSSSSDLFGNEEEGDLFGTEATKKAPALVLQKPKPKKPAGAVSMFGGLDPLAGLKQKLPSKEKEETPPPKEKEETLTPKEKKEATAELFDDDDGDLFGSKPEKEEAPVTPELEPKPVVPKVKRPPGAVSMFGGLDPFALKKKTEPEVDTSPVEAKDPIGEESASKEPTSPDGDEPRKRPGRRAMGGIEALQASLAINPSALRPGAKPPVVEPEPIVASFDQPAEVQTLQSSNKDRAKILTRRRPQSRRARKTASHVSDLDELGSPTESESPSLPSESVSSKSVGDLFGNDDLLSEETPTDGRQKPAIGEQDEDNLNDEIFSGKKEASSRANKKDIDDDLFGNKQSKEDVKTVQSKSDSDDDLFNSAPLKSSKTKGTNKRSHTIEKPSAKRVEPKSAARIPTAATEARIPTAATETRIPTAATEARIPTAATEARIPTAATEARIPTAATEQRIPTAATEARIPTAATDKPEPKTAEQKSPAKASKTERKPPPDDDIFADASINKKKVKEKKPETEDDDLLTSSRLKTPSAKKDTKKAEIDDDDELFASALEKQKPKKSKVASTKSDDLFKDDTDIFADIPASKPREKKAKKTTAAKQDAGIFKGDTDDIFATEATPKTKKALKKEVKKDPAKKKAIAAAAADSIFDDKTSIFDDPLSATGK